MTSKLCKKCLTFIEAGKYCPECGQQLYPDVGQTIWYDDLLKKKDSKAWYPPFLMVRICLEPKFDIWTGEKEKAKP